MCRFRNLTALSILLAVSIAPALAAPNGFQRCAACHLPTGQGVPGVFPPLGPQVATFAAAKPGRDYLVMVVKSGVAGPIEVAGKTYMGVMPAQGAGLKDGDIADILNYIVGTISDSKGTLKIAPFTAEEVAGITIRLGRMTGPAVNGLRKAAEK